MLATEGCAASSVDLLGVSQFTFRIEDSELILSENSSSPINITKVLTRIIDGLFQPKLMSNMNSKLEVFVSDANEMCTGQSDNSARDNNNWWDIEKTLLVTGAGFAALSILVGIAWAGEVRRKAHLKTRKSGSEVWSSFSSSESTNERLLSESSDESLLEITNDNCAGHTAAWLGPVFALCSRDIDNSEFVYDALIVNNGIPLYARVLLPMALLANMALFTWSNMTLLATINGTIRAGGKDIDLGELFDFSFQETVQDMWDAKVYLLAVLLVFSSGLWPYFKLLLTLLSFVLPSRMMSLHVRDQVLLFYDSFGKYSLVDIFLMDLLMVAFHFDIFIVPGVELVAYVVPKWGFYAFLLATMTSLLLGHWAVFLHRSVCETHLPSPSKDTTSMAVMDHVFVMDLCIVSNTASLAPRRRNSVDGREQEENRSSRPALTDGRLNCTLRRHEVLLTRQGKLTVTFLLVCCLGALVLGCVERTFSFHFKGLVGYLMGSDAVASYSVFEIGSLIPSDSNAPNSIGIRWIQFAFFAYAIAMPFLFLLSLLVLWIVPFTVRTQKRMIVAAEVLCAWSGMDVFVLALVVSLFEISQFAQFIVVSPMIQSNLGYVYNK